jgi:hypothetical protein
MGVDAAIRLDQDGTIDTELKKCLNENSIRMGSSAIRQCLDALGYGAAAKEWVSCSPRMCQLKFSKTPPHIWLAKSWGSISA